MVHHIKLPDVKASGIFRLLMMRELLPLPMIRALTGLLYPLQHCLLSSSNRFGQKQPPTIKQTDINQTKATPHRGSDGAKGSDGTRKVLPVCIFGGF